MHFSNREGRRQESTTFILVSRVVGLHCWERLNMISHLFLYLSWYLMRSIGVLSSHIFGRDNGRRWCFSNSLHTTEWYSMERRKCLFTNNFSLTVNTHLQIRVREKERERQSGWWDRNELDQQCTTIIPLVFTYRCSLLASGFWSVIAALVISFSPAMK